MSPPTSGRADWLRIGYLGRVVTRLCLKRERGYFMRLKLGLPLVFALLSVVLPSSAGALIGDSYDSTTHPSVAYADNGVFSCSGPLLAPTVMLTPAHCFSDSTS